MRRQSIVNYYYMKNIYSAKSIVVLSFIANFIFGAYLLHIRSDDLISKSSPHALPVKKASVEGVRLFDSNQLQSCYNSLLKREPNVDEGTVQLHMILSASGSINHLELVKNDLQDADFAQCIVDRIRAQRFPASIEKAGKLISHKFNFHRKDRTHLNFTAED